MTKDLELPIAHKKVNNYAQNKIAWNTEGSALVAGDSAGNVSLYGLAEKYRRIDSSKADHLKNVLNTDMANADQWLEFDLLYFNAVYHILFIFNFFEIYWLQLIATELKQLIK